MSRIIFLWLVRIIIYFTTKLEVIGEEKIPREGKCIFAANHLGRIDVFLVYYVVQRKDIIMTVAEKYREIGLYRIAAKALDAIWIDRYSADFGALRQVIRKLENGGILGIAPEGTRSKAGSLIPGKHGTAFIASKTQSPIYPVALIGTDDKLVKNNLLRFKRSEVCAVIGDPFYLPKLSREKRKETLASYTDEIMCQIAVLLPEKYRGVYSKHSRLLELIANKKDI